MPPKSTTAAVGLVAAALIVLQVSFTRLVSYKLFYHFVFLAIALSLLGLGAAGTFVAVRRAAQDTVAQMRRWLVVLAGLTPVALVAMAQPPFTTQSTLMIKLLGNDALIYLAWCAAFMVALNFAGGVVLTLAFKRYSAHMGRLYTCDLLGAGAGCLIAVALMKYFSPPAAFLSASLLSCAALGLLLLGSGARREPILTGAAGVLSLLVAGVVLLGPQERFGLIEFGRSPNDLGQSKPLSLEKYEWNHIIRTDHVGGSYVLDGEASTPVMRWSAKQRTAGLDDPAYVLAKPAPEVAVIGCGGGLQVVEARRARATHITAIDINPSITHWVMNEDHAFNRGLFDPPTVNVVNAEGRHAIRSLDRKVDVIVMHAIDTYAAAAAGAYALTENFLYTKEAMKDYLTALNPGGVMSIQRWLFNPPRENLRLFATALEAFEELGYEHPERHIIMLAPIRDWEVLRTGTTGRVLGRLLFSPTPFTDDQLTRLRAFVERSGFSSLYTPGGNEQTPFRGYLEAADRDAFRRSYPYVIKPVTDASPYVFQYYNPFDASAYRVSEDWATSGIYQSSAITLLATLLASIALSLLLIILPLGWASWRARRAVGRSATPRAAAGQAAADNAHLGVRNGVFFACLGVGFMALEVPLTQVLALYLGHPVYGFSVVLVALLVSSGLGSLLTERLPITRWQVCVLIAALLALLTSFVFPFVHGTMQLGDFSRFTLALLLIMLCGLPMGFPLALAVRELGQQNPSNVAWAWGVNGAASVIGSCLVMMVMVFGETRYALVLGTLCYAIAAAVSYRPSLQKRPAIAPVAPAAASASS